MFGRNLLVLVALILLAQGGIGLLFRQWIQAPRVAAMQQYALQQGQAQRALLLRLDAAGRAHWQASTGSALEPRADVPDSLWLTRFMHDLAQQLDPADYQLRWQQQTQPGLWLGMRVDAHWYWYELDSSALHPDLPALLLWVVLGGGLLALLGAVWLQRRINRPLQQLAAAALAFGQNQGQPQAASFASSPDAPLEISQLAHSMQRMAQDLQDAEQERALLLAGVSHDLRTPLTKLRLAVEILSTGDAAPEDAALLQGMVQHIANANSVIGQFIDFARSNHGEAGQELEIGQLLAQLVQELAPHEAALLQFHCPDQPIWLLCHPVALRRALVNLLENALRYGIAADVAEPGKAQIELRASIEQGALQISVADRGPGIPPGQLARVRQPFTRLQQQGAGAGLGLAIVERIMRLHDGQMQLQARPGGGLVVRLIFPASRCQHQA
jgi:two-component system osmolarity sensor histidine kinase EnvZ